MAICSHVHLSICPLMISKQLQQHPDYNNLAVCCRGSIWLKSETVRLERMTRAAIHVRELLAMHMQEHVHIKSNTFPSPVEIQ